MHELRALVVDDSKVGRLTMMKKLEAMGMKVELAESGPQALDYLAQHRPDMIFMDHMMPEMDGFEVTRRIKASPAIREIPVIIISGNDEANFVEEARAAGAIDAIAKPPATEVLETLLASLPKLRTETAPVAEPPPQPAKIEAVAAPAMDLAELHALVARLAGAAITPLRSDLMAEISQRMDRQAAAMTELQARADGLAPQLENLHQGIHDVQARVNDRSALIEQKTVSLVSRLDTFAEELAKVSQNMQSMRSTQAAFEQRIAQMQETMRTAQPPTAPVPDAYAAVARGELNAIQTELSELRERLSESRLHQLIAQTLSSLQPASPIERAVAVPEAAPAASERQQAELAQLQRKVKALAVATVVGGVLLLLAIGMSVFGG